MLAFTRPDPCKGNAGDALVTYSRNYVDIPISVERNWVDKQQRKGGEVVHAKPL